MSSLRSPDSACRGRGPQQPFLPQLPASPVLRRPFSPGKTLGSDLRKGKLTLPILMLLSGRNGADKEHFSQLILDARFQEISELLTSPRANGALTASIDGGQALISEAQSQIEGLPANKYTDALIGLADALREMLEQFRS